METLYNFVSLGIPLAIQTKTVICIEFIEYNPTLHTVIVSHQGTDLSEMFLSLSSSQPTPLMNLFKQSITY